MSSRNLISGANAPLYRSIAGLLRTEIVDGRLTPGSRIPTIGTLAETYGVARVTVRQAIAVLINEDLLVARQGSGTFVTDNAKRAPRINLEADWQHLLRSLHDNKPVALEVQESVTHVPIEDGDGLLTAEYRYMRRVHHSGDMPYCVIEIYLDRKVYDKNSKNFDRGMVIPLLRGTPRLRLEKMRQTIRIGSADLETARLLGIEVNAPIAIVKRIVSDTKGRIIYWGSGHYRGDLVVFGTTFDLRE